MNWKLEEFLYGCFFFVDYFELLRVKYLGIKLKLNFIVGFPGIFYVLNKILFSLNK